MPDQAPGSTLASTASAVAEKTEGSQRTACCVVGGGPAGTVLSLLLARKGVPVLLLEQHQDFNRDFRGDQMHPSILRVMDEIGLADRLLQLPHVEMQRITLQTPAGRFVLADLSRLPVRLPFIIELPQARFLEFIVAEAKRYPNFQVLLGARVEGLIEEQGVVRGVRYRQGGALHEVHSLLTVGTDGRFSAVRKLAGFEPIRTSPPMDILWLRLPRRPTDSEDLVGIHTGSGRIVLVFGRPDEWQLGLTFPKGRYQELRAEGLDALRRSLAEVVPEFADRVDELKDWRQASLLSVEANRLGCWYRPGLLLLGDAAHTMSPVGGVGISYAIQDAVIAANVLAAPLKAGRPRLRHLRSVQRQREWPVRIIQAYQSRIQGQLLAKARTSSTGSPLPLAFRALLRVPILRDQPGRLMSLGIWPVHVKN